MGKRRDKLEGMRSQTLPPSPTYSSSSSSSDFEFTVSISPRKASSALCPADELFYKGQLLPLHLSPRLSMVRTLLSSSSSDTTTTASRDSTGSTSSTDSTASFPLLGLHPGPDCSDSSRPSSVAEDDDFKRPLNAGSAQLNTTSYNNHINKKNGKYSFSLSRFSSVFKKEPKNRDQDISGPSPPSSVKRMSSTAREVIRKYLKKVKPLYEKLSQKQQQQQNTKMAATTTCVDLKTERSIKEMEFSSKKDPGSGGGGLSMSFSGNLRYPRRNRCASSCPSSIRSSPSHSGVLSRSGFLSLGLGLGLGLDSGSTGPSTSRSIGTVYYSSGDTASSMEELQNAIQGAIAHCKNSMLQKKGMII